MASLFPNIFAFATTSCDPLILLTILTPDTDKSPVVNLATASRFPCTAAIGLSPASSQLISPIAPPILRIISWSLEYPL